MHSSVSVVLLALVACAIAQVPKVHIRNAGPFTIDKGFSQNFTFSLDEPIICEDPHAYCAVVILITNPSTKDLVLDNCQVKWTNADWFVTRSINVKATENFKDDGEKTFVIKTEPVVSASEYYKGFNPVDLTLKTRARPTRQCSGTGDPHYVTFDGYYYHEYGPGQMVLYAAPWRDFEIQARVFSRPALHCALAAREGNDVFYVNRCPGDSGNVVLNFNSPKEQQPIVSLSGSRYTVTFRSGAQLIFDMHSYYMNVYVNAPGMDYGKTTGMCGNFDGNPANDAPAYVIHHVTDLFASQKVTSDLWAWKFTGNAVSVPASPFSQECAYVAPVVSRPVLAQGDSEDITDILKGIQVQATNKPMNQFTFEDKPADVDVTFAPIDADAIAKACNDGIKNTVLGQVCAQIAGLNLQTYVDNCIIDITTMQGDTRFVKDAFNAMQASCAEVAGRDPSTYTIVDGVAVPNPDIVNNICPNSCSGRGTCTAGVCTCTPGFMNVDCSFDSSKPATVTSMVPSSCDAQKPKSCPTSVSLFGFNFFQRSGMTLTCKFGDTITNATFVSPTQVLCQLPAYSGDRTVVFTQAVTFSNDAVMFSTSDIKFTYFDSICHACSAGTCISNPNSCIISGVCHSANDLSTLNVCQTCQPAKSTTAWSFDYNNAAACGPQFEQSQYTVNILDVTKNGTVLTSVNAANRLVASDASNKITYSVSPNSNNLLTVNPSTGVITTIGDINPSTLNLQTFNARFGVIATDSAGHSASVNVFITFQGTNRAPVFAQPLYTFNITENSALNTILGSVVATDPNAGQTEAAALNWDKFAYSWIIQEVGFGDSFTVNNVTGAISNAKNIDFEAKSTYLLSVRALDGGGMFSTTDVVINVMNVNEPPTSIVLDNLVIAENRPAGTVVGSLSAVDPDAGNTFTYTLRTAAPFTIVAGKLQSTSSFNFESSPNTYSLVVRVTDQDNLFAESTFTVSVTDVNEAPNAPTIAAVNSRVTITGAMISIKEDFPIQTPLASVSSIDVDAGQTTSCSIVGSTSFEVSGNLIVLTTPLDFETVTSLSFRIACSDTGVPSMTSAFSSFSVSVSDANEGGQKVSFVSVPAVPESAAAGTVVGFISAIDPDFDATTLSFATAATDNFAFVSSTPTCKASGTNGAKECTAQLIVRGNLDFETKPIDSVQVTTIDNQGLKTVTSVAVPIVDVNEAPSGVDLTSNLVVEGAAVGTVVGNLIIVDADASPSTYTVTMTNSAAGAFALKTSARRDTQTSYELVVADGSRIDFETAPSMTVSFSVTDNGTPAFTSTLSVSIAVTDAPMSLGLSVSSVAQGLDVGRKVGVLSLTGLDRPSTVPTYTLTGADASFFTISYDSVTRTANVLLAKSLAALATPRSLAFTGVVTFQQDAFSPIQASFNVVVNAVNQVPAFTAAYPAVYVSDDASLGFVVVTVAAQDPENSPITYSLSSSPVSTLFQVDPNSGVVRVVAVPSGLNIHNQNYNLVISASDGVAEGLTTIAVRVVDGCFVLPEASPKCNGNGVCSDSFTSFTCACDSGFTGATCDEISIDLPIDLGNAEGSSASSGSSVSSASLAGILIAVIVILVVIVIIVLVIVRSRKSRQATPIAAVDSEAQGLVFKGEAIYDQPEFTIVPASSDFETGTDNPIYSWYQPTASRQECEDLLAVQDDGAFVIRDSSFTPGWHMLAVKNGDNIVHERIKLNVDGSYQLLPSTNINQPAFGDLPNMVEHYAACKRQGVSFALNLDNSVYDNKNLREAPRTVRPLETIYEIDAPAVPVRERERLASESC